MSSDLEIGFVSPSATATGPRQFASMVHSLEDAGAASLWAPGHIASGRPVPEAITGLTRLAAVAERATIGTAVLLAPLYHPVIVAKQFVELDRATNRRVVLGVGVGGEYQMEFDASQTPLNERGARCDEAIAVYRSLFAGGPQDNTGRFWPFSSVSIDPAPTRAGGPPIVVAGRKPRAMRRAALMGDGWMPFLYSPDQYARSVATIRAEAEAHGRNLAEFHWMSFVYVSMDDDADLARRRAAAFIGGVQAGDGSRFEAVVDKVAITGTRTDVASRLQAFIDAGARHLILLPCATNTYVADCHRLLQEVVPELEVPR